MAPAEPSAGPCLPPPCPPGRARPPTPCPHASPASLEVPVVVFAQRLQDDGDQGHDGLHNAELQRGLGVGRRVRGRGRGRGTPSALGGEGRSGGGWEGPGTHLLAEAQKPDGVGHAPKAAGAVEAAGPGVRESLRCVPGGHTPRLAWLPTLGVGVPGGLWGDAHRMGFPRISAMMALSPPRYWKQRLRKL